ncbi:MAG: PAS domain S-box protein [Acidobacteria bacterium]|nr:PAS domain S-box protein [Acidobacteriota bacterium]MBV9622892.1 PAS domain S-box protein [Acidobacteriota bacterium]
MIKGHISIYGFEPRWSDRVAWYGSAIAATALSWCIWWLSPVMHQDPFVIFILAVVFIARFYGFGPAVVSTFSSALVLDYFMFRPRLGVPVSAIELQRLGIFILISVLVAGLARQRSRAETKADEVRQELAAIVTSSEDAIISFTVDGIVSSWNHGAEVLYGYTAGQIVGRPLAVLIPGERTGELETNLERLNRGERVGSYETERVRRDGTRVRVLLSVSPIRNEKSELVGASAISRDIGQQKRTEEALRRNERLATAGRLTAAIAHEIRNPLEALTNLVYLARRDLGSRDEYLGLAEQEIGRLDSIAQQALGFVREATFPERLDAGKILEEVLQLYLRKLQQNHIRVDKRSEETVAIFGFPGELRQLFSNLILNAMEAMKDGGRLRLRVTAAHEWAGERRPGVRVTIADTGTGIHNADLPHIFEPFYTTKKENGTGLGLWLAYGIVQKHTGSIRVASRTVPGRSGTVFMVFLPESPAIVVAQAA